MKNIIRSERVGLKRCSGRSKQGRVTVRGRGGGAKRIYKKINLGVGIIQDSVILGFETDRFRTAPLAIVRSLNGQHSYILKAKYIKEGDVVKSPAGPFFLKLFTNGSRMLLWDVPLGQSVYNVSSKPTNTSRFLKAAGAFGVVVGKEDDKVLVKIKTKMIKSLSGYCHCCIGEVCPGATILRTKAGQSRWAGRRPKVRGVAINPVDHPHGGGEGKGFVGRPSVSPWGKKTIGKKK